MRNGLETRRVRRLAGVVGAGVAVVGVMGAPSAHAAGTTHTVGPKDSVQAVVDAAHPGDTVVLKPGTYRQSVKITVSRLTLRGTGAGRVVLSPAAAQAPATPAGVAPGAKAPAGKTPAGKAPAGMAPGAKAPAGVAPAGKAPAGKTPAGKAPAGKAAGATPAAPVSCAAAGDGICVNGANDVRIEALTVTGFAHYGIWGDHADGMTVRGVVARNNGQYGIGQQKSVRARIVGNVARDNGEAGILLANAVSEEGGALDTKGAEVAGNALTGNKMGLVLRRVRNMTAEANAMSGNCAGLFVVGDENVPRGGALTVRTNVVTANTRFCAATTRLPAVQGAGIVLTGVEKTVVEDNTVSGNTGNSVMSGGIVLFRSLVGIANTDNTVRNNVLSANGPADIADRDTAGKGNVFSANSCAVSLPTGHC